MASQNTKKPRKAGLIRTPLLVMFFLVLGYVGSVLIEYTGILFGFWGVDHTQQMITEEVGYFNTGFQNQIPGIPTPSQTILSFIRYINVSGISFSDIYGSMKSKEYSDTFSHLVSIPFGVFALFGIRLIVCFYSILMFMVFVAIALQEGFLSRHLRKLGGGEESSFKYHLLKRQIKPAFVTGWTIYLLSPFSFHPNNILVPMGIAFGFLLWATTANWKKIT